MATLAATAAPKLSEMSEGAKAEKSRNELDKLIKQAGQFYQDTADIEGADVFPVKINIMIQLVEQLPPVMELFIHNTRI